ncbi:MULTISPECIES: hypothetical protein [Clostridium]|uniref:hypothetical protein n=1 Tax=Clostridium TaxID=1485 RepID=UPI0008270CD3|nr:MULTISPECIES: hypothetical protein [Clostridium]PJI09518.1 GGDEF domain-containing protein [Clostridium sp. CT7]
MKDKEQKKFVIKMFILFMANVITIFTLWYAAAYELNNNKRNVINAFMQQQYLMTNRFSGRVQAELEKYINEGKLSYDDAGKKVAQDIIKKETNSKNNYMFLYDDKGVIFERNDSVTSKYKNMSIKNLFHTWEYNGGKNFDNMKELVLNRESGSDEVIKDNSIGREIVSWCSFKVKNKNYILGISVSENYLIEETLLNQHDTRIIIFAAILTAILIIISTAFLLHMYFTFKKVVNMEKIITEKNIQIEKFISKLSKMESNFKKASIYDSTTGAYNMEFFYSIIRKIDIPLFLPIVVILAQIENIHDIDKMLGREKTDKFLNGLVKIFMEKGMVSRIAYNKFAILKVNGDKKVAGGIIDYIKSKMNNYDFICSVSFKLLVKNEENDDLKVEVD